MGGKLNPNLQIHGLPYNLFLQFNNVSFHPSWSPPLSNWCCFMMLPQLKIHVNGSASVFRTAERGVLHIEISSTTTTQSEASSNVSSTTETVINTFRHFAPKTEDGLYPHASAGITAFSASAPETSTFIPRDKNGREISQCDPFPATAAYLSFTSLPEQIVSGSVAGH